jgi:hypothetical protein
MPNDINGKLSMVNRLKTNGGAQQIGVLAEVCNNNETERLERLRAF